MGCSTTTSTTVAHTLGYTSSASNSDWEDEEDDEDTDGTTSASQRRPTQRTLGQLWPGSQDGATWGKPQGPRKVVIAQDKTKRQLLRLNMRKQKAAQQQQRQQGQQ